MSEHRSPCNVSKCQEDAGVKDLGVVEILVLAGATVSVIIGLFDIFGSSVGLAFFGILGIGWIWNLIWGIVAVILSIGLIAGLGFLPEVSFKITANWIWLFVIGLVIFIPTGNWGGIVVIVAAVVKAVTE